ncbi:MAG: phenylacetic acid degradation protein [Phyllobacteriaceae bacterium]|nr:phenylacetic acid degradation protein [Phyllobacteriaceae bacterium]MBA93302.1 phenylacetic acid degradation protein [Phyllobacteriaceae bacterium]
MTRQETEQERRFRIAGEQPPFGRLLGVRVISAEPDRVEAELTVTPELGNRNGVMHGGAIIGLADNMGGTATFINLSEGQGTTTVESKTNFFRAIEVGSTIRAVCEPLHKGRKTMVWQIRILREDGKLAAIVTQTQLII